MILIVTFADLGAHEVTAPCPRPSSVLTKSTSYLASGFCLAASVDKLICCFACPRELQARNGALLVNLN
jgi:hypothetical protein